MAEKSGCWVAEWTEEWVEGGWKTVTVARLVCFGSGYRAPTPALH